MPLCVAGFFAFVQPPANVVLLALGREPLGGVLSLDFGGGVYGLLLVGGYLARRRVPAPRTRRLAGASRHCMFCRWCGWSFSPTRTAWRTNVRYNCFLLAGQALCLFELLSRVRRVPAGRLAASLARCSFGIYLVHVPVQTLLKPVAGRHCRDAHAHRGIFCPAVGGKLGAGAFSWKNTGAGQGAVLPAVRSCARVTL